MNVIWLRFNNFILLLPLFILIAKHNTTTKYVYTQKREKNQKPNSVQNKGHLKFIIPKWLKVLSTHTYTYTHTHT